MPAGWGFVDRTDDGAGWAADSGATETNTVAVADSSSHGVLDVAGTGSALYGVRDRLRGPVVEGPDDGQTGCR